MKKFISKISIFILSFSSFLVLLFSGCASSPVGLAGYGSIAVIGVTGNKNLSEQVDNRYARSDEEDIDDTSALSVLVDKFLHGENPELLTGQDRVDYAEEYFRLALEDVAGLEVSEKEKALESEQYKNSYESPLSFLDTWISATGYSKNLYSISAKKARLMMGELGVKSLVSAEFRYNKLFDKESKLNANVRAQVIMDVILYDSNGKKVVFNQYEATSSESLPVKKFDYDKDALVGMYPAVIETVINRFITDCL